MGATISVAAANITIFTSTALAALNVAWIVLTCPFRVLRFVYTLLAALFGSLWTFAQNWRWIILIVLVVAFTLTVGPLGVTNSSFFFERASQFYSCFVRPLWETSNKVVLLQTQAAWIFLADGISAAFTFIGGRFTYAFDEAKMIVQCFVDEGNVQILFDLPSAAWILFGSLPFSLFSAPRQNKVEVFAQGEFGYHYPYENVDPSTVRRFEFNPEYAAQGPAMLPGTAYPNAQFAVRDYLVIFSRIWEDVGKFAFGIISKLARPSQRFFPALYVSVTQEESLWREAADIVCRAEEALFYTSLWPYGPGTTPHQDERDAFTGYACRLSRVTACFLAEISLVLNDLLTSTRPIAESPGECPSAPSATVLLRGVPIVDFFVTGAEPTPNIFRSNVNFCEFQVELETQTCGGLALGSLSVRTTPILEFCPEWSGAGIPLADERIDYVGRIIACIGDLVSVFLNPSLDTAFDDDIDTLGDIVACWINWLTFDIIYVFNAIVLPVDCQLPTTLSTWLGTRFSRNVIKILQFAYQDSCSAAIVTPEHKENIFLCFIAFAARSGDNVFWDSTCALVDNIPFTGFDINCSVRKRSIGEPRTHNGQQRLSYYQRFRLLGAYYAYETRNALSAFDYCFVQQNSSRLAPPYCHTECAVRPCIDSALDCVVEQLVESGDANNAWVLALEGDSYARMAARAAAMAVDTAEGCSDGDVGLMLRTLNSTADVLRDMAARSAVSLAHFGTAHSQCRDEAAGDHDSYVSCIQLTPLGDTWEETLALSNITADTNCGRLLHARGIVLDRSQHGGDSKLDRVYEGCITLLAYGARARASNATSEPLASFIDGWSSAHAAFKSTEEIFRETRTFDAHVWPETDDADNGNWFRRLLAPAATVRPAIGPRSESPADDVAELAHEIASVAYAYFNYQADVYEHVVLAPSSGARKDQLDSGLFRSRVLSVTAAITSHSAPVRAAQHKLRTKVNTVHRAADAEGHVGIAQVARVYGNSLLWVDRLHAAATNAADRTSAQADGLATVVRDGTGADDSAVYEFRVRQRFSGDVGGRGAVSLPPLIGVRVAPDLLGTVTFADHQGRFSHTPGTAIQPLGSFAEFDLASLATALEVYSHHSDNATLRRQASVAVTALGRLDAQIAHSSSLGDMIGSHIGRGVAALGRISLRITWNLIANRLRLGSLPAVQASHVLVDVISGGKTGDLQAWLGNERGYIVGVGYVEREVYDNYMREEASKRSALLQGPWGDVGETRVRRLYASSTLQILSKRMRRQYGQYAEASRLSLPGTTKYGAMIERHRAQLRRKRDFRHRSHFLLKHGLHDDEHLHAIAGPNWRHYEAALLANGTQQRREFSVLAAQDAATNEFWLEAWDAVIAALGGGDGQATSQRDSLGDLITQYAEDVWLDLIQTVTDAYDQFLLNSVCDGPQDYLSTGVGSYKWGCLPFPNGRLFNWVTQFPSTPPGPRPYDGVLDLFIGTGEMVWPPEMIAVGGNPHPPRDPAQCPVQTITMFDDPVGFFEDLCITNACRDPLLEPSRPACAFGCDYREMEFKSAAEFGFTSGWHNIAVWSATLRAWIGNAVLPQAADGVYIVIFLFLLSQFPGIIPFGGILLSYTIIALALFGDTFITITPELFAFTFLGLYILTLMAPLVGWIAFVVYLVNLWPVVILGRTSTLLGARIVTALQSVSPDSIIVQIFIGIGNTAPVVNVLLRGQFDIKAASDNVIGAVGSHLPDVQPTVAEFIYSLISYYNYVELVLFAGLFSIVVVVVLLVLTIIASCAVDVLFVAINLFLALRGVRTRLRIGALERFQVAILGQTAALEGAVEAERRVLAAEVVHNEEFHEKTERADVRTRRAVRRAAASKDQ